MYDVLCNRAVRTELGRGSRRPCLLFADTELRGAVGLKELFLVLALLCARAVDQRVKALYLLGPDLYHLLSGAMVPPRTPQVRSQCSARIKH